MFIVSTDSSLAVQFYRQSNQFSCGAAALQMVYDFWGLKSNQAELYKTLREKNRSMKGAYIITLAPMIEDAHRRKFYACLKKFSIQNTDTLSNELDFFLHEQKIPIIACLQWRKDQPLQGHYRVLIGRDGSDVILHDPAAGTEKWPMSKLTDYWYATGPQVPEGHAVIVAKAQPPTLPSLEEEKANISDWRKRSGK